MRRLSPFHRLAVSFAAISLGGLFGLSACESSPVSGPSASTATPSASSAAPPATAEEIPSAPPSASATASAEPEQRPPWAGPFFTVLKSSVGIYSEPVKLRRKKLGYAGEGARLPVYDKVLEKENCSRGWYELVDGGYVCGNDGSTNEKDQRVIHAPKQPNLEDILPYRYARNIKNGTPLYRSVPNRDQMKQYEPYLFGDAEPPKGESRDKNVKSAPPPTLDPKVQKARDDQQRRMAALRAARAAMLGEKPDPQAAAKEEQKAESPDAGRPSWWQEEDPDLRNVTITDLAADSDDVLSSRLVKGFYIAVDKVFDWERRRWLRSTKGYVAPAERFHFTQGSDFHGVQLDETWQLPVGWVYGWSKSKPRYQMDPDTKQLKADGKLEHFEAVNLTGREEKLGSKVFVEAVDGFWVRQRDLRITRPGPPPDDLLPGERWVDVNLATQSLVLFEGTKPVYATLISSGKQHKVKEKDHRTPSGQWRIREKHIAATMDGDGTASDLPYSIEGVPYVMYFHKAYALHGAFWHRNYGVRMSHGCVNLAPLDAKHLFFNTDPPIKEGWHGSWAREDRPGSRVIVHE